MQPPAGGMITLFMKWERGTGKCKIAGKLIIIIHLNNKHFKSILNHFKFKIIQIQSWFCYISCKHIVSRAITTDAHGQDVISVDSQKLHLFVSKQLSEHVPVHNKYIKKSWHQKPPTFFYNWGNLWTLWIVLPKIHLLAFSTIKLIIKQKNKKNLFSWSLHLKSRKLR